MPNHSHRQDIFVGNRLKFYLKLILPSLRVLSSSNGFESIPSALSRETGDGELGATYQFSHTVAQPVSSTPYVSTTGQQTTESLKKKYEVNGLEYRSLD